MRFRTAHEDDLEDVAALLSEAELPPLESSQLLSDLIVAVEDRGVVGSVGLEVYGRSGLLRSMVIAPDKRAKGIGRELFRSLLARANELGLKELFLLTESATGFFDKLGFAALPRERAPDVIRDSRAYRELCPETVTLMRLPLA